MSKSQRLPIQVDISAHNRRGVTFGIACLWLLTAVAVAWLPSIRPYIPVSDDFPLADALKSGLVAYLRQYFPTEGVWRLLQQPIVAFTTRQGPLVFPLVAFVFHILTALFFMFGARRLGASTRASFLAALLTFAFPFSFQAVLWASASGNLLTTCAFWLVICLLLTTRRRRRFAIFWITMLLTFAAMFTQENLLFDFALSAVVIWIPRRFDSLPKFLKKTARNMRQKYHGWGPTIASVVFAFAYLFLRSSSALKRPGLHLASLISPYARVYAFLYVFQPLLNKTAFLQAFRFGDRFLETIAGATALMLIAFILRRARHLSKTASLRRSQPKRNGTVISLTVLLFAGSAVFAVTGGFGIDSRKRYELAPLIAVLLAVGATQFARQQPGKARLAHRQSDYAYATFTAFTVLFGVISTWAVVAIYHQETVRASRLVQFIANRAPGVPFYIEWSPDMYRAFPKFEAQIGDRLDVGWELDQALESAGRPLLGFDPVTVNGAARDDMVSLVVTNDSVVEIPPRHATQAMKHPE